MLYLFLLIYSIPPKHVLIALSDFGAREEQNWNLTLPVQFSPPHPGKSEIPTLGTALKVKFPTPGAQVVVKSPGFVRWGRKGMLKFWFARRIGQLLHDTTKWQGVSFFLFYILIMHSLIKYYKSAVWESSFNLTRWGGAPKILHFRRWGSEKIVGLGGGGSENVCTSKPTHDIIIQIGWFQLDISMTSATQPYHVVYRYSKCSLSNYYTLVHPKNIL